MLKVIVKDQYLLLVINLLSYLLFGTNKLSSKVGNKTNGKNCFQRLQAVSHYNLETHDMMAHVLSDKSSTKVQRHV